MIIYLISAIDTKIKLIIIIYTIISKLIIQIHEKTKQNFVNKTNYRKKRKRNMEECFVCIKNKCAYNFEPKFDLDDYNELNILDVPK